MGTPKKGPRIALMLLIGLALLIPQPAFAADWRAMPLVDVRTGEAFRIADFAGRPILLEAFAVWCPVCTKQQKEIAELHDQVGERVVSISIDVDPNEEAALVREHAESKGFDWRYAVSPPELTRALMAEFGTAVVAATATPVVLIDESQNARLLKRGLKRAEFLEGELER